MDYMTAVQIAAEHGNSWYVFDPQQMAANADEFRAAFRARYPRTELAYVYKTNYLPVVCETARELGLMAQVDSEIEYWLARRLGVDPDRIVINGTDRPADLLMAGLRTGALVNLDSMRDLRLVQQHMRPGEELSIGLRCSLSLDDGHGSRFGLEGDDLDDAVAAVRSTPGLRLAGLHAHYPVRSVASFAQRTQLLLQIAERHFPEGPDYLDVGGSFYGAVPTHFPVDPGDQEPTAENYAQAVAEPMSKAYGDDGPLLILEPGTALVARAFTYVTRVIALKTTRGRSVAVVDGSVLHTSPNTRRSDFPVTVLSGGWPARPADYVYGSTLMDDDIVCSSLSTPIAPNDFLWIRNVGAYSLSMAPALFHRPVPAVLVQRGGSYEVARAALGPSDVLRLILP